METRTLTVEEHGSVWFDMFRYQNTYTYSTQGYNGENTILIIIILCQTGPVILILELIIPMNG